MVVSLREYIFVTVGSIVLSLVAVAMLWPWTRQLKILITIAVTTTVGIAIWNTALNVANASSLNVDSPILGLSAQDVGSGVAAFLITLVGLFFVSQRRESLRQIVSASGLVGLLTILVDLFG